MKVLHWKYEPSPGRSIQVYSKGRKRFEIHCKDEKIKYCKIWSNPHILPEFEGKVACPFPYLPLELRSLGLHIRTRAAAVRKRLDAAAKKIKGLTSTQYFFNALWKDQSPKAVEILACYDSLVKEERNWAELVDIPRAELVEALENCFVFYKEIDLSEDMVERLISDLSFDPPGTKEELYFEVLSDEKIQELTQAFVPGVQSIFPGEYWVEETASGISAVYCSSAKVSFTEKKGGPDAFKSFSFGLNQRYKTEEENAPFQNVMMWGNRYTKCSPKFYGKVSEDLIQKGMKYFFS